MLAFILASIGITCSVHFQRTHTSLAASYSVGLPLAGLLLRVMAAADFRFGAGSTILVGILVAVPLPFLFQASFARMRQGEFWQPPKPAEEEDPQDQVGLQLDPTRFPDKLLLLRKRATFMPDGSNPVFDRETRFEIFGAGTFGTRATILGAFGVSVAMGKFWFYRQYVYTGYLMLFGTILTALSTSRCMTHEKEQASLALLHTTTLSSWRIVMGKLMANCRYVAVLVGLLMVPTLIGSCTACVSVPQRIRATIGSEPLRMLFVVLAIATAGSVGLFWSLMLKRTASAMSAAVLSLSTLYAAPLVVQELFQRFTRVPMERLEWIAYISPFGALPSLGGGRGDTAFGDDIQGVTGGWWLLTLALYLGLSVILIAVSTHLFERVSRRQENRA